MMQTNNTELHLIKRCFDIDEVIHVDLKSISSRSYVEAYIKKIDSNKKTALLFSTLNNGGSLKRTISLLTLNYHAWLVAHKLKKNGLKVACYGIYPSIEKPTFIFELKKSTQRYADKYLIPDVGKGFKGLFKKIMKCIIGYNPSIVGIIIRIDQ